MRMCQKMASLKSVWGWGSTLSTVSFSICFSWGSHKQPIHLHSFFSLGSSFSMCIFQRGVSGSTWAGRIPGPEPARREAMQILRVPLGYRHRALPRPRSSVLGPLLKGLSFHRPAEHPRKNAVWIFIVLLQNLQCDHECFMVELWTAVLLWSSWLPLLVFNNSHSEVYSLNENMM